MRNQNDQHTSDKHQPDMSKQQHGGKAAPSDGRQHSQQQPQQKAKLHPGDKSHTPQQGGHMGQSNKQPR